MAKNILIFSDGTGQAGGARPDQRLSNVYKIFRASRTGPESPINPMQQVAFYDAGLGTDEDNSSVPTKLFRSIHKTLGSVTGRGITRNVTDCYEAILNNYEEGDRIFLFGFSRGAYTARSIAGVLSLCGVPTLGIDGGPLPRHKPETRAVADEAVRKVYEHGAGRPTTMFADQRNELANRFRKKYGSDFEGGPNASPHFIGVFDTVASLGAKGLLRFLIGAGLVLGVLTACYLTALLFHFLFAASVGPTTAVMVAVAVGAFTISSIRSTLHVIRDWPTKGKWAWHIAKWHMENYDRGLASGVRFARHAIAIDETRADFPRVEWGYKSHQYVHVEGQPDPLIQCWFAGNHSDIGGSYPEEESRLSDIALEWMVGEATSIPDPLIIDRTRLRTFPFAGGMQHCEVDAMRDTIAGYLPRWWPRSWRPTWRETPRLAVKGAPLHPTVIERFALPSVLKCGQLLPYRPTALREDERLQTYYQD